MRVFAIVLCYGCLLTPGNVFSQSVSINTDGSMADPSAILDIKSSDKGVLVPRLTSAQRANIANPAPGLIVFDTGTESFWFHTENTWINLLSNITGWSLSGNTASDTAFIGTTNNQSLLFKANGQQAGKIDLPLYNTFWGYEAGESLTTGFFNVGMGSNALQFNTAGSDNTAVGRYSLYSNSTGFRNTASGSEALYSNTIGSRNTAMGYSALWSNDSGSFNIAIGMNTLYDNYTGSFNTAIGNTALTYNTTGDGNTAVGMDALFHNSMGNNNTALGYQADVLSENLTNATAIGYNAKVNCNNCLVLGGTTSDAVDVGIGNSIPAATLDVTGPHSPPSFPGINSTGIVRIGVGNGEAIDIGKIFEAPHSGWIQVGVGGIAADPLSLQPVGGNVGIGTIAPTNKLSVAGNVNITGSIGVGVTTPDASAQFEVNSTSKGFLPPRMTFAQRNSIVNPAPGLIIWCNNCDPQQLQVSNGTSWTDLIGGAAAPEESLDVGEPYAGGILAYVYQPGDPGYIEGEFHGFVTTPDDITTAMWGCVGVAIPGADGLVLGTGTQNTTDIVNGCGESPIAARESFEYVSLSLDDDWVLPSKDELYFVLGAALANGTYHMFNTYWSSSEVGSELAWAYNIDGIVQLSKSTIGEVRPIRYF